MKENKQINQLKIFTATKFFLVAVLLGTVSVLLIASYYNYFALDDYYFANLYKKEGVFKAVAEVYMLCGGRYTSSALLSITPLSFGNYQSGAMFVAVFVILFLLTSCVYFFKTIICNKDLLLSLALTGLFLFALFSHIPNTAEAVFWAAGSLTYTIGVLLYLFFISFLIKLKDSRSNMHLYLAIISYILTIGTNETILIISDLSFGALLIHEIICTNNRRWKQQLILLLLIGISFSLIEIMAPGNFERTKKELINVGDSTPKMDLKFAVVQNFIFLKNLFIEWNSYGFLVLFFLVSFVTGYNIDKHKFFTNKILVILILPVLLFLILYISSIPTYYTFGFSPPRRAQNVLYFFTLFFLFIHGFLIASFFKNNKLLARVFNEKTQYLLPIFVVLFVGITSVNKCNIKYVLRDYLNGSYAKLKADLYVRYNHIATSNSTDTLFLENLSSKPEMLFHGDITPDPSFWVNMLFCDYYRIKATRVVPFIRPTKWSYTVNFDSEKQKKYFIKEGPQKVDSTVYFSKPASCLLDSLNRYSINLKIDLTELENKFDSIDGLCVDFKVMAKGNLMDFSSIMLLSNPLEKTFLDRQEQVIYSNISADTKWVNKKVYFEFTNKQIFKKENYITLYFWNRLNGQLNIDDIVFNFY